MALTITLEEFIKAFPDAIEQDSNEMYLGSYRRKWKCTQDCLHALQLGRDLGNGVGKHLAANRSLYERYEREKRNA